MSKIVWNYGSREFTDPSELLRNDEGFTDEGEPRVNREFRFLFDEAVYFQLYRNKIEVTTRNRWLAFITCPDHMEAIRVADYLAPKCRHCYEILIRTENIEKAGIACDE